MTSPNGTVEDITGHYVHVEIEDVSYRIYYEENGPEDGIPIICQHTAGNHGQQWRHVLASEDVTRDFRVIAYDLPFHGKSLPPTSEEWWKEDYILDCERFTESIVSITDALGLDDPIYLGSSIGGNVTLELADWYPERFRALIGLGTGAYSPGYFLDWFHHPQVNTSEVSAYSCWGLMAPQGPEWARRENMHLYEQGSNGLFRGDLYYYGVDHDYRGNLDSIDPQCPMYVMNGEYDFATNPDAGFEVAEGIDDEQYVFPVEMEGIGHFPMCENPDRFLKYLSVVLEHIQGKRESVPTRLSPDNVSGTN